MFAVRKEDKKAVRKVLAIDEYDYDEWSASPSDSAFWIIVFREEETRLEPSEPTETDVTIFDAAKATVDSVSLEVGDNDHEKRLDPTAVLQKIQESATSKPRLDLTKSDQLHHYLDEQNWHTYIGATLSMSWPSLPHNND